MEKDDSVTRQTDREVPEESASQRSDATSLASETESSDDMPSRSSTVEDQTEGTTNGSLSNTEESDHSQSIEDMLLEFDDQEGLIRDRSLLDPNHIVEESRIVGRDEQLQEVTKMLRVALGANNPPNLFLYGPSGTGKSLITKAVCENIEVLCEIGIFDLELSR